MSDSFVWPVVGFVLPPADKANAYLARLCNHRVMRRFVMWVWSVAVQFSGTYFAQAVTWVGTVFGGMLASNAEFLSQRFLFGSAVVFLAVLPLAVLGLAENVLRVSDETLDGREAVAHEYAARAIDGMVDLETETRANRVRKTDDLIVSAVKDIYRKFFNRDRDIRVVFYRISDDGKRLEPSVSFGRPDAGTRPRAFDAEDNGRGSIAMSTLQSPNFHVICNDTDDLDPRWGAKGRPYKSFVSLPIRDRKNAYGMLTVDSEKRNAFTEREGKALETYASLIAFYLVAAFRGRHQSTGGNESAE